MRTRCLSPLLLGAALAAPLAAAGTTEEDYLLHCVGCHRDDGSGSAANRVPDLRGSVGHFPRLAVGRAYLVQVAGVAQSTLPDSAVAALLNWLLPTFSAAELPADFAPYTAAEVARLRSSRPGDLDRLRQQVAAELAASGHFVKRY